MRIQAILLTAGIAHLTTAATVSSNSTKRGLIYIPQIHLDYPGDSAIFLDPSNTLTWYYNYQSSPSPQLENQTHLQFVPMMWGNPENGGDYSFSDTVSDLIRKGHNITHVMGFNEPDGPNETGGSDISPKGAAASWIRVLEPLREKHGLKLVGPATTGGPDGFVWLAKFFEECDGRCNVDVMPVHWYGDFIGFSSHLGEKMAAYPNTPIWVTEYAFPHGDIENSNRFFNESAEYMDRLAEVERYSYFGAFRSERSNVGPYAAMLTEKGELTDIGSLYLGGGVTGKVPDGKVKGPPDDGTSGAVGKWELATNVDFWIVLGAALAAF